MPDVKTTAAGFYAINGTSVLMSLEPLKQELIGGIFEAIREQNPSPRILLVLDNFSPHILLAREDCQTRDYTRVSPRFVTASSAD